MSWPRSRASSPRLPRIRGFGASCDATRSTTHAHPPSVVTCADGDPQHAVFDLREGQSETPARHACPGRARSTATCMSQRRRWRTEGATCRPCVVGPERRGQGGSRRSPRTATAASRAVVDDGSRRAMRRATWNGCCIRARRCASTSRHRSSGLPSSPPAAAPPPAARQIATAAPGRAAGRRGAATRLTRAAATSAAPAREAAVTAARGVAAEPAAPEAAAARVAAATRASGAAPAPKATAVQPWRACLPRTAGAPARSAARRCH